MKPAAVVIPVYREELRLSERVSFRQAQQVLGKYDICFMAPEKMKNFLSAKGYKAEYFPAKCLSSRLEYSKLLLTPEFYARFSDYQYILLYQLDAFVFSDRLHYFCSLGYDFLGAPMPYSQNFRTHVGLNGGLSLRKIDSCIRVTKMLQDMKMDDEMRHTFEVAEDKFFSYCGGKADIDFSVPNGAIASDFAIEFNVAHCWDRLSPKHLPFGCHAWSKSMYFDLWCPYIESFVGKEMMDRAKEEAFAAGTVDYYKDWIFPPIVRYLIKRILREGKREKICAILRAYFRQCKPIAIWGYGKVGRRCLQLLSFAGIPVRQVFDKNALEYFPCTEVPVIVPDENMVKSKDDIIVVSTTKYYDEIARHLKDLGLKEQEDFFPYREMEKYMVQKYYLPIWRKF